MKRLSFKSSQGWFFRIALVGIVIRVVLSIICAHPDIWALDFARYHLFREKIFNFWDYLANLPPDHQLVRSYGHSFFTYPPLAYFTFGFFGWLVSPLAGPELTPWIMDHYPYVYELAGIGRKLFWLKAPYLLFDLGIAFCLRELVSSPKQRRLIWLLWWLNPLSLYAGYLVGQFELMPTFFMMLSLLLVAKKKPYLAAASLGVGGGYKMFPLFFLPLLVVHQGGEIKKQLKLFAVGLIPFVLSILPFVRSAAFRSGVLFSNQSEKFLRMSLPVSNAEGISVFIFLWGVILFYVWQHRNRPLWWAYLAVMTVFFSVTHYHPQWMVWLSPLVFLAMAKENWRRWYLPVIMMASWFVVTLFFEPSLHYGAFLPLKPELKDAADLSVLMAPFYDPFQLKTIVRSLFAAAGMFLLLGVAYKKDSKKPLG